MNNLKTAGDVPTLDSQHSVKKHLETAGDVPTLDLQHSVQKHLPLSNHNQPPSTTNHPISPQSQHICSL